MGDGGMEAENHIGMYVPMQQPAWSAHVPQNLKYSLKKEKKRKKKSHQKVG